MDKLRQIAEAATPGPWECVEADSLKYTSVVQFRYQSGEPGSVALVGQSDAIVGDSYLDRQNATARFIATFNPAKVLELLAVLQAAEARALAVEGVLRTCQQVAASLPDDGGIGELAREALSHQKAQELGSLQLEDQGSLRPAGLRPCGANSEVGAFREAFLDLIADAQEFDEFIDEDAIYYTLRFTDASLRPLMKAVGIETRERIVHDDGFSYGIPESPAAAIQRVIASAAEQSPNPAVGEEGGGRP